MAITQGVYAEDGSIRVTGTLTAGDIEIGAVEIKDATTDNRVVVSASGGLSTTPTNAYAQGSTTSGELGTLTMGAVTTTNPSYTTAQTSPLSLDPFGFLRVGPDCLVIPSVSVTSATTLFTQDMIGYESITVQVTSAGTTCTNTYETSDDNTNWVSTVGLISSFNASTGSGAALTTSTLVGLYTFPRRGRYFRARVSTYTSGTVTVVGTLHKNPATFPSVNTASAAEAGAVGNVANAVMALEGRTTSKTSVATAQQVRAIGTLDGRVVQRPHSIPENEWGYAAAASGISNTTTAVTIQAAGAAGVRNYCTGCQIVTNGALGAATEIAIRDGAGGTVLWRGFLTTAGTAGYNVTFPNPLKGTAATLMEFVTLTASITGAVYFNAQGYVAP